MDIKRYLAEFLGTFTLTFVVLASSTTSFMIPTPVLAGLVLLLFVYTIGPISGCNINPAVTVGLWSTKQLPSKTAILYIISQLLGAVAALLLGSSLGMHSVAKPDTLQLLFAEGLGTAIFTFGIAAVVFKQVPAVMSGIVIGGSLLLGIVIAILCGSGGILNPAVALGLNSFTAMNVLGQLFGAVVGMFVYRYLYSPIKNKKK